MRDLLAIVSKAVFDANAKNAAPAARDLGHHAQGLAPLWEGGRPRAEINQDAASR
jgi:hypothetical protein